MVSGQEITYQELTTKVESLSGDVRDLRHQVEQNRLEQKKDLQAEREARKKEVSDFHSLLRDVNSTLTDLRLTINYSKGASSTVQKFIHAFWTLAVGVLSFILGGGSVPGLS